MADQAEQSIVGDHVFCAHCGTENPKDGYACTRCGERLIEVRTDSPSAMELVSCSRCGGANHTRAAYCWVCGTEMKDAVRISPAAQQRTQSRTTARTYHPDLNPVSAPTTKLTDDQAGARDRIRSDEPPVEQQDLRGPTPQSPDMDAQQSGEESFGQPDASVPNTSGTRNGVVPPEVKRWNWAAFLMPVLWGLFSGVPFTALLFGAVLLPSPFGQVILLGAGVFLGFRGNELAWRGKKWRSVEHFNSFQKTWTSWAVRITIAFGAILFFYVLTRGGA
jgi:ribosomal protein L40E